MLTELGIAGSCLLCIFALYMACPFIFSCNKRIRNAGLYVNFLNVPHPWFYNLKDPSSFGLENACNESLALDVGMINIWSIKSASPRCKDGKKFVVLYSHGNSCNRAVSHRVGLYTKLCEMGLDVVTFDYRGFGDSIGVSPDENTVVHDADIVLQWVDECFTDYNIVVWGHSLGTGITVKLLSSLKNYPSRLKGLILESPFLNSGEAGRHIPVAKIFDLLPFTKGVIGNALEGLFPTDKLIFKITLPILILHAKDDRILPIHHSYRLYEECNEHNMTNVSLKVFDEGQHKFLYAMSEAMTAASDFIYSL
jgi:abhydrolase domain-containing protein 12